MKSGHRLARTHRLCLERWVEVTWACRENDSLALSVARISASHMLPSQRLP